MEQNDQQYENKQNVIINENSNCQRRQEPMTICIAAICDRGNACVISADREITLPSAALEYEHNERKIDVLSKNCVVMSW